MRKPRLGWSPRASRRLLGHYDPAHDAIVISRIFDTPQIPRYVVEYVVFHEMLHLKHPVQYGSTRRCVHSAAFKADEKRFPRYFDANRYLQRLLERLRRAPWAVRRRLRGFDKISHAAQCPGVEAQSFGRIGNLSRRARDRRSLGRSSVRVGEGSQVLPPTGPYPRISSGQGAGFRDPHALRARAALGSDREAH